MFYYFSSHLANLYLQIFSGSSFFIHLYLNLVFQERKLRQGLKCYFYLSGTSPRRRQWHPTQVLLPGKSHRWRSLVGCSPWGLEESDMTGRLHFHFSLSCIGEGNGHPLQRSCLENPRDGGAWWAAVHEGRTESDMTDVT